jgi:hypothetical protein
MQLKNILYFIIFFIVVLPPASQAQIKKDTSKKRSDTSVIITKKKIDSPKKRSGTDTARVIRNRIIPAAADTSKRRKTDTPAVTNGNAQTNNIPATANKEITDTLSSELSIDSADKEDSMPQISYRNIESELLARNRFVNVKDPPAFFLQEERVSHGKEFLFYSICAIVLLLGIFKSFYRSYFNNLFRVFFNTSLRQSQLAEQLLQAKLPSFILNIFFTITMGVYIWLLLKNFHPVSVVSSKLLLPFCIAAVACLYFIKYCILKFVGWLSEISETTNNYIFVIFLVNKITGIILVPFIILLAFAMPSWISSIARISILVTGLFFLSRYVKSYAVIQRKISVHPFHFLLYIAGAEIIPLFIIYKLTMDYLI